MFGAGLGQVGDAGGASVGPGQEVVCVVVQGVVVAAGEGAFAVAEPQPLTHGFGEAVAGASDFQRGAVAGVGQDAVEGIGALGDQAPGDGGRDRPVPVEHGRFVRGAEQGQDRDGDQDLRPRGRNPPRPRPVPRRRRAPRSGIPPPGVGEEPGGGEVGAELGEGPGLVGALEGAGGGGGPFPDPGRGVCREVGGEPGHAVAVREVFDPPVFGAFGVAFFDADRVVAFAPGACFGPEPGRDEVPGRAAPGGVGCVRGPGSALPGPLPGGVQAVGFVDDDPGVLPGDRP